MVKDLGELKGSVSWIAVGKLIVKWPEAQRDPNEAAEQKIADEMNPDLLGIITVTLPLADGFHHVIDGQTRIAGVRIFAGDAEKVLCKVIPTTDRKVAAHLFRQLNIRRRGVSKVDAFKSAVHAGVEHGYRAQVAINNLVTGLGYRIDRHSGDGVIRSVVALEFVYKRHGETALRDALLVIQGIWGMDQDSVDGSIIKGFAEFLARHGADCDRQRLVDKVAPHYSPRKFFDAARSAAEMFQGNLIVNIGRVLLNVYNTGLRAKNKLPE